MSRLDGALLAVRQAIETAGGFHTSRRSGALDRYFAAQSKARPFSNDDDLVDDIRLNTFELQSVQWILEEVFSIPVPDEIWNSPKYRTAQALAEWCIRQRDLASEIELQRQRRA